MAILNSKLILAKGIKMDKEYNNVLSFGTNAMLTLLNSTAHYVNSSETFAFIGGKNTNVISCPFSYEECLQSNYIAYQNPSYSSKWFFAFITNVIYKSDGMTQIEFEIDAWTTWFEDWTKKACYINRQHVNDDTIGLHTVNENLDVGDVIEEYSESVINYGTDGNDYYFCINTTWDPVGEHNFGESTDSFVNINGNLVGNFIFCFTPGEALSSYVNNFIYKTNQDGKIDAIKELYILPKVIIDNFDTKTKTYTAVLGSFSCLLLKNEKDAITIPVTFDRINQFSDYIPKNNKLFCYPYNYLLVSNNVGNQNIYKYEDFEPYHPSYVPQFELQMSATIGASIRLVPRVYKNIDYNYDESLPLAKFPTCSWSSDAFTNWLTQNAVNIGTQIIGTVASTGVAIATSGTSSVIQGAMAGISPASKGVLGLIGEFREASLLPNIIGGNNNGDINFSNRTNQFILHHMRAKTEYLRILDDYFSRFRLCHQQSFRAKHNRTSKF